MSTTKNSEKWWEISIFHQEFLHWWLSSDYKDGKHEKEVLRVAFGKIIELDIPVRVFDGQMLEMVKAGTSYAEPLVIRLAKSSKYTLNIPRVEKVLELGGILEND